MAAVGIRIVQFSATRQQDYAMRLVNFWIVRTPDRVCNKSNPNRDSIFVLQEYSRRITVNRLLVTSDWP